MLRRRRCPLATLFFEIRAGAAVKLRRRFSRYAGGAHGFSYHTAIYYSIKLITKLFLYELVITYVILNVQYER